MALVISVALLKFAKSSCVSDCSFASSFVAPYRAVFQRLIVHKQFPATISQRYALSQFCLHKSFILELGLFFIAWFSRKCAITPHDTYLIFRALFQIQVDPTISTQLDRMRSERRQAEKNNALESALIKTQLKEIQRLKKDEDRQLDVMRQKHLYDMNVQNNQQNKEQEQIVKTQERELEKVMAKATSETEAFNKQEVAEEKKVVKALKEKSQTDLATFQDQKKKERKHAKEELKDELQESKIAKDVQKVKLKEFKEAELQKIARAEEEYVKLLEQRELDELKNFKMSKLAQRHALARRLLEEVCFK